MIVKSVVEIEYLKKANRIIAELFEILKKYIKPGITTKELDKIIEDYILSKGGVPSFKGYSPGKHYKPYPASSCISVNEEVIHGIPGDRVLKDGDIVSIDIGTNLSGYYGDAAYTYTVGENVSLDKQRLVNDTYLALMKAIEVAKEGSYLNEIGKAISFFLTPRGYGIVRDYCGHGVGKSLHEEPPVLNYYDPKRKGPKLKKGMVLAIEPMITLGTYKVKTLDDGWTVVTLDGKPAAHWEHSIVITDGEPIILSVI
ncbi:MAG: type I methionyl aminopeptidase [Brevinematales bacterium]|nr:type I methionyl aminopeptidase [Brevinematales bacterium]